MATVTLKNVDEGLLEAISELARRRKVSVEDQLMMVLREGFERSRSRYLLETADQIAAMTPKGIEQIDSTILIREERDGWSS